jgi:ATPase subunit of ABC transporter with duplicated ATPase domains
MTGRSGWSSRRARGAAAPWSRWRPRCSQRGAFRIGPLDVAVRYGDRILLRGSNDSGKSTVIAALLGELAPSAGGRTAAPGAVIARLGQKRDALDGAATLTTAVRELTGAARRRRRRRRAPRYGR